MAIGATGGVARGCGTRVKGGVYLELGLGPNGVPVEFYVWDPPMAIPEGLTIAARGMQEWRSGRTGVYHITDWVGAEYYPYPPDAIEEVRRYGLSRRIASNFNFSLITGDSKLLWVHPRALLKNWRALAGDPSVHPRAWCPRRHFVDGYDGLVPVLRECHKRYPKAPAIPEGHPCDGESMCAGLWWQSAADKCAEHTHYSGWGDPYRTYQRRMPAFGYLVSHAPEWFTPEWEPGFIARWPLSRIVVVDDPGDPRGIQKSVEAASAASLPVEVVDE